jgi:LacI family transcriptional regulator
MVARVQGYKDALASKGLTPVVKEIVFNQDEDLIIGPIESFLKEHTSLDAVFFGTNHVGACGLKVINSLGIKVPEDLAVVSFDDYDVFKLYKTPVTAIAQPIVDIADNVITVLLNKLNNPSSANKPQGVILKTELRIRDSSK